MSLYVYCLGEDLPESAFEGLAGVGGARVRALTFGGLTALVSEAGEEAAVVSEENLLAHNRVNAAALAVTTPLPCRFGTRAAPERLAEYVSNNEAALSAALARVRGRVEMSVKLMGKAEGQKAEIETEGGGTLRPVAAGVELGAKGAGTAFLLKKRREILGEEGARRRAEEAAAWLASGVGELARETAERLSLTKALLVGAAHLVERGRVEDYRVRLRALAAERRDLRLLTSGPWPPYSFSDIKQ
ncbi:MAG TPA: GvpL/GvpF family gas vesicle protein [Pyrinomonadaceae bacterium]|nr:GvpL/GvpF family gas vesicle protein [Pyrinomonadaceae bacterium]